jgi:glycosyltransferase involved in cell wall biosynthesis
MLRGTTMQPINKRGINILFISPLPPPLTGQAIACKILYDDFIAQGHSVDLVNLSKASFVSGVDSLSRVREIFHILRLVHYKQKTADYIYFTPAESLAGNLKDIFIYFLIRKNLSRTFIHLHGGAGMRVIFSSNHPILKRINYYFINQMKGVIVLGERLKSIYHDMIAKNKIHIAHNFSLPDYFITRSCLKRKTTNMSMLRILFLSNLLPGKGYQELFLALKTLPPEKLAQIRIDFAGGFEDESSKQSFISEIKSFPQIKYHGIVTGDDKKKLLQNAHVFCLPTYYPYEGQPISILEAYAAGCTVITTDHSGIFDIFTPGINGLQVEIKNINSIAEKISFLLENKNEVRKYSIINAYSARKKYRVKDHLATMNSILNFSQ